MSACECGRSTPTQAGGRCGAGLLGPPERGRRGCPGHWRGHPPGRHASGHAPGQPAGQPASGQDGEFDEFGQSLRAVRRRVRMAIGHDEAVRAGCALSSKGAAGPFSLRDGRQQARVAGVPVGCSVGRACCGARPESCAWRDAAARLMATRPSAWESRRCPEMTVNEAALRLELSASQAYALRRASHIDRYRLGLGRGRVMIEPTDLEADGTSRRVEAKALVALGAAVLRGQNRQADTRPLRRCADVLAAERAGRSPVLPSEVRAAQRAAVRRPPLRSAGRVAATAEEIREKG
jgi:hypothetical protein